MSAKDDFATAFAEVLARDPFSAFVVMFDAFLPGWQKNFLPVGWLPGAYPNLPSKLAMHPRDPALQSKLGEVISQFVEDQKEAHSAAHAALEAARNTFAPVVEVIPFGDPASQSRSRIDPEKADAHYRRILASDPALEAAAKGRPDFLQWCWYAQTFLTQACEKLDQVDERVDGRVVLHRQSEWLRRVGYGGHLLIPFHAVVVAALAEGVKFTRTAEYGVWRTCFALRINIGGWAPGVVRVA